MDNYYFGSKARQSILFQPILISLPSLISILFELFGTLRIKSLLPNKSTLNLVRAVKGSPYKLVLVGKESANQKAYVEQVHSEAGDNVYFLGTMPHAELRGLYSVARVHALVSWMETPGLSSLEAGAMDCNIVVTKKGDTYDYFGDYAFYCEPDNVASIRSAIDRAFASKVDPGLKKRILENYTWEKTADETIKGYQKAISSK